jgi:hypothetical protein
MPSTADSNSGRLHSGPAAVKISYIVSDFSNWLALEHGTLQTYTTLSRSTYSRIDQWRGHQRCSNYVTSPAAASSTWRMQHLYKKSYRHSSHKHNFAATDPTNTISPPQFPQTQFRRLSEYKFCTETKTAQSGVGSYFRWASEVLFRSDSRPEGLSRKSVIQNGWEHLTELSTTYNKNNDKA